MKNNIKYNLIEIIIKIGEDKALLDAFLIDLLTPAEYAEINKRWKIIKMLDTGINQHKIATNLHVGIATVTRGSRALQDSKGGFKKVIDLTKI
ncbi:MAG TPA: Trp family transcriptional regulator [Candidatus Paceibacterota bacterium]